MADDFIGSLGGSQQGGANTNTTADQLRNQVLSQIATNLANSLPRIAGTFTLGSAATTTVPQTATKSTSFITLTAMNASAATLMGSAKALYISAQTQGASFTVATASAANAAGTEQFSYTLLNLV